MKQRGTPEGCCWVQAAAVSAGSRPSRGEGQGVARPCTAASQGTMAASCSKGVCRENRQRQRSKGLCRSGASHSCSRHIPPHSTLCEGRGPGVCCGTNPLPDRGARATETSAKTIQKLPKCDPKRQSCRLLTTMPIYCPEWLS